MLGPGLHDRRAGVETLATLKEESGNRWVECCTLGFLLGSLEGLWMHSVASKCFSDGKQEEDESSIFCWDRKKKLIPAWLGLIECLGHTRGC